MIADESPEVNILGAGRERELQPSLTRKEGFVTIAVTLGFISGC
jgi:hypothetical protein